MSRWDYKPSHILLNEKHRRDTVDEKIKNLKIQYNRPDEYIRDYQVIKMMQAANRLKKNKQMERNAPLKNILKIDVTIS